MSVDIINMNDRMPSLWNERMAISDLAKPAAVDPDFNRQDDRMAFWKGEAEIDSERGQPSAVNAPFSLNSFDYLGWGDISESMREELMKLRELIDTLEHYASAKHKGLVDEQVLARGAFDGLEEEVDEVVSGLEENNDAPSGEPALVANQPDAYSELTGSDFDWRDEGAIISYVLEMAA